MRVDLEERFKYHICKTKNLRRNKPDKVRIKKYFLEMKNISRRNFMSAAVMAACIFCASQSDAKPTESSLLQIDSASLPPHPRLFLRDAEIPALKAKIRADKNLEKLHSIIIKKCDEILKLPLRKTKMDDDRRRLSTSREVLRRVFYLAYAYRMTGEEKYFSKCKAELMNAAGFETWNPTHFLDVGEMAMAMSIGYDWLYEKLSPAERKNIEEALLKKAFEVSDLRGHTFFWRAKNNWNQVCCGSLACAAMAAYETAPERCAAMIKKCVRSNAAAQSMYAPDGAYPEGVTYWDYGSSFEALFIEALKNCFGEDFGLSEADGFLDSPLFVLYSRSGRGELFNFADCGNSYRLMPALSWFAREAQNPDILFGAYKQIASSADGGIVARLLPMFLIYAPEAGIGNIRAPAENFKTFGGGTPLMFIKTDWQGEGGIYLAAKGGRASENHAHMDVGSFVYESLGVRWAIDLGAHEYATLEKAGVNIWDKRQNSDRWKILRYSNFLHNTLTVNDALHNVNGFAALKDKFETPQKTGARFDLTEVFAPALEYASREIALVEGGKIRILDEVKTPQKSGAKVSWRMCTRAKVQICDGAKGFILSQDGKKLRIWAKDNFGFKAKTWSAKPSLKCEYQNKGVSVIGFEADIPSGTYASLEVFLGPVGE